MTDGGAPHPVSRSAERTLELLESVLSAGRLSLGEAAERVGLPVSTALRHLRGLEGLGYLVRDEHGSFSAGPRFVKLAINALGEGWNARLTALAEPRLQALVDEVGETAYLAVRDGHRATYVASVESPRAIRHVGWVGRSVPLEGTAVGAALSEPQVPAVPDAMPCHVNTGAAEPDVTAVCVPVYGRDGTVVAAVSVIGPDHRLAGAALDDARAAAAAGALALSVDLGAPAAGRDAS